MHRPALCATVIVPTLPDSLAPSSSLSPPYVTFPPPPPPTFTPFSFSSRPILSLSLSPLGLSLLPRDGLSFRKDARIALSRAAFNSRR